MKIQQRSISCLKCNVVDSGPCINSFYYCLKEIQIILEEFPLSYKNCQEFSNMWTLEIWKVKDLFLKDYMLNEPIYVICVYIYICVCVCVCVWYAHTHMYMYVYIYMSVYMYICIYICVCIYIYIYIYIYTHTHTWMIVDRK